MDRKSLEAAALGMIAAVVLGISGCGEQMPPQKYNALLQDSAKQIRVIDDKYRELEENGTLGTLNRQSRTYDVSSEIAKAAADAYNATKPAADKREKTRKQWEHW